MTDTPVTLSTKNAVATGTGIERRVLGDERFGEPGRDGQPDERHEPRDRLAEG